MSQNEVDDAYLGGENPGGKAGCGSENKVPLIAAANTGKRPEHWLRIAEDQC
jgi:hypothetical protein